MVFLVLRQVFDSAEDWKIKILVSLFIIGRIPWFF